LFWIVGGHGPVGTREDVWYVLVFVVVPAQDHREVGDVKAPGSSVGQILNAEAFASPPSGATRSIPKTICDEDLLSAQSCSALAFRRWIGRVHRGDAHFA
jgi:hypothetical protein